MNAKEEIKSILPKKRGNPLEINYKTISPRNVLKQFEEAINEEYSNYLKVSIMETSAITENKKEETLSYSFYLIAFIGRGYNYKLFEIVPKANDNPYPVDLILFQNKPQNVGSFNSDKTLYERILNYFKSTFTTNVINNIMAQVDLYNESNNKNTK